MDGFCSERRPRRAATAVAVALLLGALPAQAQEAPDFDHLPGPPGWEALPDWSGVWDEIGNTVFDHATAQPPGAASDAPGTREFPPLTDEWEALYVRNQALRDQDRFPDPMTVCGMAAGFPRIFNGTYPVEFVVRPEQTWILTEDGPNVMRIYTDGRAHPPPEDRWNTYTGDSVGYWDGDTLVFSTVAVKNEGTIIDRTGLVLSDEMTAVTRIRKNAEGVLEVVMTLSDPLALAEPWTVVSEFRKLEDGFRIYDYVCAENPRNAIAADGQTTLFFGPDGEPLNE